MAVAVVAVVAVVVAVAVVAAVVAVAGSQARIYASLWSCQVGRRTW